MSTPALTRRRQQRLRSLCKRHCHGDRTVTKDLIAKMEKQFHRMPPATQDELMDAMEKSLALSAELAAHPLAQMAPKPEHTGGCPALE